MENPFELIISRLDHIETLLQNVSSRNLIEVSRKEEITFFDVKGVSEYLYMTKSTIYKMTSDRRIPHYKRSKLLYFKKEEIDQWVMEVPVKTMDEIEKEASDYLMKSSFKR